MTIPFPSTKEERFSENKTTEGFILFFCITSEEPTVKLFENTIRTNRWNVLKVPKDVINVSPKNIASQTIINLDLDNHPSAVELSSYNEAQAARYIFLNNLEELHPHLVDEVEFRVVGYDVTTTVKYKENGNVYE